MEVRNVHKRKYFTSTVHISTPDNAEEKLPGCLFLPIQCLSFVYLEGAPSKMTRAIAGGLITCAVYQDLAIAASGRQVRDVKFIANHEQSLFQEGR